MRNGLIVPIVLLVSVAQCVAEDAAGAANREAMKKLDYLKGNWAGEATSQTGPGAPVKLKQTEIVKSRLGGVVLEIEGIGKGAVAGTDMEGIVFNALAIIHYDVEAKQYRMRALRANGQVVDPEFKLTETGFEWSFSVPRANVKVRYIAKVDKESWNEIGEVSVRGGEYQKMFEMNLKKVKE